MLLVLQESCYCTGEHLKHKHSLFFHVLCCAIPTSPSTDPVFPPVLTSTAISLFPFLCWEAERRTPKYFFLFVSFPSEKKGEDFGFLLNPAYTSLKVLRSRFIFRLYSINYAKLLEKTLNFVSYHHVWNQTNKADEQKFKSVIRVIACLWTVGVFLQNIFLLKKLFLFCLTTTSVSIYKKGTLNVCFL